MCESIILNIYIRATESAAGLFSVLKLSFSVKGFRALSQLASLSVLRRNHGRWSQKLFRLGGSAVCLIKFCKNSFALPTMLRNRLGNQPFALMDWLAFPWISVCFISKILVFPIPDMSAISDVLFHSCLAVLSASISAAFGLFLPIFFVGR